MPPPRSSTGTRARACSHACHEFGGAAGSGSGAAIGCGGWGRPVRRSCGTAAAQLTKPYVRPVGRHTVIAAPDRASACAGARLSGRTWAGGEEWLALVGACGSARTCW